MFAVMVGKLNTLLMVVKPDRVTSTHDYWVDGIDITNRHLLSRGTNRYQIYAGITLGITTSMAVPHIYVGDFNTTNSNLYIDGALDISGDIGAKATAGLSIGSNSTFTANTRADGCIAEILFINKRLTTTEREDLSNYLSSKWGVALS